MTKKKPSSKQINLRLPIEVVEVIERDLMGKVFSDRWSACINQIIIAYLDGEGLLRKHTVDKGQDYPLDLSRDEDYRKTRIPMVARKCRVPIQTLEYLDRNCPLKEVFANKAARAIRVIVINWLGRNKYV